MTKVKSLQQQLQEAIEAGDLSKAQTIVEGMKELNKLAKKTTKKKTVAKTKKPAKKVVKPKKSKLIIPTEEEVVDLTTNVEEDEIVDLTSYVDEDDDEGDETSVRQTRTRNKGTHAGETLCRTEPMNTGRRKIEFFGGNTKEGDAKEDSVKANPALAKMYSKADKIRPAREKRKNPKAKVKCYVCGKVEIIALNLAPNVNNGESYKCNECVTSQGE